MVKEKESFKALMVKASTHKRVVVKAKELELTVDEMVKLLFTLIKELKKHAK